MPQLQFGLEYIRKLAVRIQYNDIGKRMQITVSESIFPSEKGLLRDHFKTEESLADSHHLSGNFRDKTIHSIL